MRKLFPDPAAYPENRLFSLDALRGLDMLFLTVVCPLCIAVDEGWHCLSPGFMRQLAHGWECFTLLDIIMPLFIFMCGAAMPFALGRRLRDGQGVFWLHVIARVALLWFLGGLIQGNWATLDPLRLTPFSNTLQSIAVGYLVVAAVMATRSRILMVVVPLVLAIGYSAALALGGDYSQYGNAAYKVDQLVLKAILPPKSVWLVQPSHYTWFLTSAMFAAMTFAGYLSTQILRSTRAPRTRAMVLLAYGGGLLAIGWVSEIWIPCIKPIFTLSFTAQAMGWCVLSLDVLYVVTDIWGFRKGMSVVLLFGQFALTAYFTSHFLRPVLSAFAHLTADGFLSHLPAGFQPPMLCLASIAGMLLLMIAWRRIRS